MNLIRKTSRGYGGGYYSLRQATRNIQTRLDAGSERNRKRHSRRGFLKASSMSLAGLATSMIAARDVVGNDNVAKNQKACRLAMVVDLDRCIGCNACSVSCKAENGVRLGGFRSWVSERETGKYPMVSRVFLPRQCNHCEKPPCQKVCPVGATYIRDDGIVAIDKSKCIGCRYCMVACPYGARYFNPRKDSKEARLFPARTFGTVDKCDFCVHRVDSGVVPACVNTCIANARVFGDLNDPESAAHKILEGERRVSLLPEFGSNPSVFYKGGQPMLFKLAERR
jgi:tetrathionate reductase subunit B